MSKNRITTRSICFCAATIALATVTANFVKLPSLPFGGSCTLFSMLFVTLAGYWFGPVTGICAAVAHGLIQFVSNPYFIHPVQVLLDYLLAFGALGLSGFFCNKKNGLIKGYSLGVFGRFVFVCISGVIFYTSYTSGVKDNVAAVWAGIVYNMSYILPEYVITIIILMIPAVKKALLYVKKQAMMV